MHYYKFNIAEWAKETGHLSLKEESVLLRLINYCLDTESFIPLKTQMVLRKLRLVDESETVQSILDEFFKKTRNGYVHEQSQKVIEEYKKMSERNKLNAKLGGRPKSSKNNNITKPTGIPLDNQSVSDSDPSRIPNQELEITNQELETKEKEISCPVSKKTERVTKRFTDDDIRFAEEMFKRIKVSKPTAKKPNFENWANSVRLSREVDKRTHHDLWKAFDWANRDEFWRANIESPEKLRKHFDKLQGKSNETNQHGRGEQSSGRGKAVERIEIALEKQRREFYGSAKAVGADGAVLHRQVVVEERGSPIIDLDNGDWDSF